MIIIQLSQLEADFLIQNVPNRKLMKASASKNHGGKTYYVSGEDQPSLRALAQLRGYKPTQRKVIAANGYKRNIVVSPVQQLLADN